MFYLNEAFKIYTFYMNFQSSFLFLIYFCTISSFLCLYYVSFWPWNLMAVFICCCSVDLQHFSKRGILLIKGVFNWVISNLERVQLLGCMSSSHYLLNILFFFLYWQCSLCTDYPRNDLFYFLLLCYIKYLVSCFCVW